MTTGTWPAHTLTLSLPMCVPTSSIVFTVTKENAQSGSHFNVITHSMGFFVCSVLKLLSVAHSWRFIHFISRHWDNGPQLDSDTHRQVFYLWQRNLVHGVCHEVCLPMVWFRVQWGYVFTLFSPHTVLYLYVRFESLQLVSFNSRWQGLPSSKSSIVRSWRIFCDKPWIIAELQ